PGADSPGAEPPPIDRPRSGLRIAMALYGTLTNDSRVIREAETLVRAGHTVSVYCLQGVPPADASFRAVAHIPAHSAVLPDGKSPFLDGNRVSLPVRLLKRTRWLAGYSRAIRAWGRW